MPAQGAQTPPKDAPQQPTAPALAPGLVKKKPIIPRDD